MESIRICSIIYYGLNNCIIHSNVFHAFYPGLFTADQNLKGGTTKYTRQNPNGNRYGYECPEERDYYPYFYPTDWIDIAVLGKMSDCRYYKRESFNIKPKGKCMVYSIDKIAYFQFGMGLHKFV